MNVCILVIRLCCMRRNDQATPRRRTRPQTWCTCSGGALRREQQRRPFARWPARKRKVGSLLRRLPRGAVRAENLSAFDPLELLGASTGITSRRPMRSGPRHLRHRPCLHHCASAPGLAMPPEKIRRRLFSATLPVSRYEHVLFSPSSRRTCFVSSPSDTFSAPTCEPPLPSPRVALRCSHPSIHHPSHRSHLPLSLVSTRFPTP